MPTRGPARDNAAGRPTDLRQLGLPGSCPLQAHRDVSDEQNSSNAEDAVTVTLR